LLNNKKYKYLIVGCGLSSATLASQIALNSNDEILIIDKKTHLAGNCYDFKDENGIYIHKYGPHAFHTNNKEVWDFLSQFTQWQLYFHKVNALVEGQQIPIPFNFNSIYKLFPHCMAERIEEKLLFNYTYKQKISVLDLKKSKEKDLNFLGNYIYENVFLGYTTKQWGLKPEELDESVTSRVPIYLSRDDRYFQDKYQGIPAKGYTEMIRKMLDFKNIQIELNTNYFDVKDKINYEYLIFTGAVDEFFNYKYGKLDYRSLEFDFKTLNQEYFQPLAQINYPENFDYTRITEFRHFIDNNSKKTTIAYEYPKEFIEGKNERYYPIISQRNIELYEKYKQESDNLKKTFFLGRLGEYKYYNMDQVVDRVLKFYKSEFQ
jgi:UDP-galactopyranose mutase